MNDGRPPVLLEQKFHEQYQGSLLYVADDDHAQLQGKLLLNSTTERLLARLQPTITTARNEDDDRDGPGVDQATEPLLVEEEEEDDDDDGNGDDGDNLDLNEDDDDDDDDTLELAIPNARSIDDNHVEEDPTETEKSHKKDKDSAASTTKCTCDHPYNCQCGNRPPRPSKGHKWDPETQAWGGKGHKQKAAPRRRDATPKELSDLQRVVGMVDLIRSALRDIATFRNRDVVQSNNKSSKKERRKNHNQIRLQALEHQRNRLHKQKIEQERSAVSTTSSQNAEDQQMERDVSTDAKSAEEENGDKVEDDGNAEEEGEEGDEETFEDPWIRMIRAINSLAIVTPILLDMFLHPFRNNKDIQIRDTHLNQKRKRRAAMCWLFGESVYDICTNANCKTMYRELCELFWMVGAVDVDYEEASIRASWRPALDQIMTSLCQATFSSSMASANATASTQATARHPLSSLCNDDTNLGQLNETTLLLDEKWGLKEEVQSSEQKKIAKDYQRSISKLHERILELLARRFKQDELRLSVYGSCLSNLSLGKGSDVDMSLYLSSIDRIQNNFENGNSSADRYDRQRKNTVFNVCRKLESCWDFCKMTPIAHARVPVIKGTWTNAKNPYSTDGSIDFDICLLNDIAVVNSSLILEYCNVDERVPLLCKAIKKWAKGNYVSSAADSTLSSYAWTNMVLVFLKNIAFVPDLQSPDLAKLANVAPSEKNPWHHINNLDTFYLKWEEAGKVWTQPEIFKDVSVTALIFGFFEFYSPGSRSDHSSPFLLLGLQQPSAGAQNPRTVFRKCTWFWAVEDPFETFNSHCPHDLASHADENGAARILRCLRRTHDVLKEAICNGEATASLEWPSCAIFEQKNDKQQQKGQKKGDGNGSNRRGNQNKKGQASKQGGLKGGGGVGFEDGNGNGGKQNGGKVQEKQEQRRTQPRNRNNRGRKNPKPRNNQQSNPKNGPTPKPEGDPSTKPANEGEESKNGKQPTKPPVTAKRPAKNNRRFDHKVQRGKNNNSEGGANVSQKNGSKKERKSGGQSGGSNSEKKED